eukprot:CAMPEP_0170551768 /NCGR_PEP_ID=MMETSP0211-20121228/9764_1 /TAXON_ID=311385 /ORGANISM="Pseudokeronopsis sp., Strain OXSARD2" /LENGTH=53 /DNA_ID=CAMNT_0010859133 /DNA_START=1989 /DNA_END=2150 /DNA_ORIENTATION=+
MTRFESQKEASEQKKNTLSNFDSNFLTRQKIQGKATEKNSKMFKDLGLKVLEK